MSEPSTQYWHYFDEAWKQIIERFFPQFLRFFVPEIHQLIDFQQPFTFLDGTMEQFDKQALKGAKVVDKLVKVCLTDGGEQWILIHIEVQGDADEDFSLRMFRYYYRIFDRYGKRIVSVAVLTDRASRTADGRFDLRILGSGVDFHYLPFNLMDYPREQLEADDNPMALVVLAAQERERLRRRAESVQHEMVFDPQVVRKGIQQGRHHIPIQIY